MKKTTLLIIFITAFLLTLPSQALASKGKISPDSRFYFVQNLFEDIRLFFTFSKEKKVDYLLDLADRRVEEIQDNTDLKQKKINSITNRYTNHFKKMERITEKLKQKKQEGAVEKIKEANLSQQETLAKVYEKVPDAGRLGVQNAQENSAKNTAAIIEKVKGEEAAKAFQNQLKQIKQVIMQAPLQPSPKMQMESSGPAQDPSQTQTKELLPLQAEKPGQQLHELGTGMETEPGGGESMEPVAPAPMMPLN